METSQPPLRDEHRVLPFLAARHTPSPGILRRTSAGAAVPWQAYESLVETYAPPTLVVDSTRRLLWMTGNASVYLKRFSGQVHTDVLHSVVDDLAVPLATALYKVSKEHREVVYTAVRVRTAEGVQRLTLRVQWLQDDRQDAPLMLVVLESAAPAQALASNEAPFAIERQTVQRLQDLEQALLYANEELLGANEELHSVHEALSTVNAEYQRKSQELTTLHEDVDNLLACTDIAALFLDRDLGIRKFTPAMTAFMPLREGDCGRPLGHFTYNFLHIDLVQDGHKVLETGMLLEREIQSRAGTWLRLRILPYLTSSGLPMGVVLTCVDISHPKQAQEAAETLAQQARELFYKNKELDDLTRLSSHDLQGPLLQVSAYSELLRKELGDALSERAATSLHYVTDGVQQMHALVQGLLTFSRLGQTAIQCIAVRLDGCVQAALGALTRQIEATRAAIVSCLLPEVTGDPAMLTQLYRHLLSNALKYVGNDLPRIHLTAERRDTMWVLGVHDNGIGIDQKYAEYIFSPFNRLHTHSEYTGTGIGLAICRKIIERHGGRIWMESAPGHGATFYFTLPGGAA